MASQDTDRSPPRVMEDHPTTAVRSAPFELGDPPAGVSLMTEDAIAKEMELLIRNAPRSWKELLKQAETGMKMVEASRGRIAPVVVDIIDPFLLGNTDKHAGGI